MSGVIVITLILDKVLALLVNRIVSKMHAKVVQVTAKR